MTASLFHMIPGGARPVAPYSHAVEADGWVFLTGQIPNHPEDDARPFPPAIEDQTRRVMDNLAIVLEGVGLGLGHVVAARVFLTHFEEDYERMNDVYLSYFSAGPACRRGPASGVTALARNARVEIDFIARRPD